MLKLTTRQRKLIWDFSMAGALLALFAVGLLSYFDYRLQDTLFQRPGRVHPDIIVIGIDEQAIDMFDVPSRWSRDIMAEAIRILNSSEEYRPAVIALDVLYISEREGERQADANLIDAAREGDNVVVAARAITGHRPFDYGTARAVLSVTGFEKPFYPFINYVSYGIINAIIDSDGRIRSTRLIYEYDGEVIYSFPYEIYRQYLGITEREGWVGYNEMFIIYHGPPGVYKQFSFADIFDDYFQPEFLADTIVLIGAFAPGLFDDFQVPNSAERMYGIEIHANILQMLLEGTFKQYAPSYINWIVFLFITVLSFIFANRLDVRLLLVAFAALIATYIGATLLVFQSGYILSVVYVVVSPVIIYIYQLIYSYAMERVGRKKAELIAEKHQILIDSINYASQIQKGILPKDTAFAQAFTDFSVIWDPRDTVGGDIYWIKNFEKGSLLCVCDCTGHGVPGALLTALTVSSLEEIVDEGNCNKTGEIIYLLDQKLARIFEAEARDKENKREIYLKNGCDLAVLFIDKSGDVTISAGNINVFVCDGKEIKRIKGQRIYVGEGKIKDSESVKVNVVPANSDNKFYVSSDGMYDQMGGIHGHSFGYTAFKKLILEHHEEKQDSISQLVWEAFEDYRGEHVRLDDFELISFKP